MKIRYVFSLFGALVLASILSIATAHADAIFTFSLDTTALSTLPGSTAGPFSLAFQLTDGSGTNDGNNTATISTFGFGSGSAAGCPAGCSTFGGASGDATSSIVLTDSGFFNAFTETFTPGTALSFFVDLTTKVDAGGVPDLFAFSILDGSGFSLPTQDSSGADTLLTVNINSASPLVNTYATDPTRTAKGGVTITMPAPIATPVPEPTSLLLLATGLAGLVKMGWRARII